MLNHSMTDRAKRTNLIKNLTVNPNLMREQLKKKLFGTPMWIHLTIMLLKLGINGMIQLIILMVH